MADFGKLDVCFSRRKFIFVRENSVRSYAYALLRETLAAIKSPNKQQVIFMKYILSIIFALQSFLIFGQTKQQNDKYNFDKDCGDGSQQAINICLYEATTKLSKIVEKKYNCIIAYLDTEIKKSKNNNEIEAQYVKMKVSLISSQATWKKLKEQNSDFYNVSDGTETPMLVSQSIIKDYKDRLIWLDNLIEVEGQGGTRILKCEQLLLLTPHLLTRWFSVG